jgi:hypothetical protein
VRAGSSVGWPASRPVGPHAQNARFSGSGRSTFSANISERLAISPRGVIELPVKICTVVDGTVSTCETPSTRSEISDAVSAASMCGQLIAAPLLILSQARHATPWRRYENSAFFLSSLLSDQPAAAARRPSTAMVIMLTNVVLPPPRCPAVTKNAGRSGSSTRSIRAAARAKTSPARRDRQATDFQKLSLQPPTANAPARYHGRPRFRAERAPCENSGRVHRSPLARGVQVRAIARAFLPTASWASRIRFPARADEAR